MLKNWFIQVLFDPAGRFLITAADDGKAFLIDINANFKVLGYFAFNGTLRGISWNSGFEEEENPEASVVNEVKNRRRVCFKAHELVLITPVSRASSFICWHRMILRATAILIASRFHSIHQFSSTTPTRR